MAIKVDDLIYSIFLPFVFSHIFAGGPSVCHAQTTNSIRPGQALGYSDKMLVSGNGRFQLGFFNASYSSNGFLGIRYTYSDYERMVWIANRETPIHGTNVTLVLDQKGSLKITRGGEGDPILLNYNKTAPNSTAVLENSGNLAVKELNPDGSVKRVLWESFDYPTDTLLPGMKLGKDLRSGKLWTLTSWLSDINPAPGAFTLEYNHSANSFGGAVVMRPRKGLDLPSHGEPIMDIFGKKRISYISNERQSYFNYSGDGWILILRVTPDGGVEYRNTSSSRTMYKQCYFSFSSLDGCLERGSPGCRSGDAFDLRRGRFIGENSSPKWYSDDSSSINIMDCWVRCWKNCSCVGFDTLRLDETGCSFWSIGAEFEQTYDGSGTSMNILNSSFPIFPKQISQSHGWPEKWWIWFIVSVAAFLVILILVYLCYLRRKMLQKDKEESVLKELTSLDGFNNKEEIIGFDADNKGHDLKLFSFASVLAATDDFSLENKLGQGGFGPVFKGKLQEGQEIAVKRLSRSSGQGLVEFKNELILIAKLQHMNLVRLLGCCVRGDEKMLIYEYMPNKSLDYFLFDPQRRVSLDWEKRYEIIEGIAQGLIYLHRYSRVRIIHRDLKASNILLDQEMNPKISDFGMARIFGRNDSEANTDRVVGTYGYMSPEYAMEGNFSEKSDVFSFGVLLLEIVSGRRNSSYFDPACTLNLVGYAWQLWKDGRSLDLIDPALANEQTRPQISQCIHVGLLCVQHRASDRPTMVDVLSMITNRNSPLSDPIKVTIPFQSKIKDRNSFGKGKECSSMSTSITNLEPR